MLNPQEALRRAGVRIVFLSKMTEAMLDAGLKKNALDGAFEAILSTNKTHSYKPDRKAYQLAVEKLNFAREEILFVAFVGCDAAGTKWFGYPTFWVNRSGGPMEELGVMPDATARDLSALVEYVLPESETEPQ
jgi:2-haloacid dehalogenase